MRFSHPILDSFYFKNSKKFAYTRKVCVDFMLQQPQFLSHQEILISMMFLSIEPENHITEALELFSNHSFTQITHAAIEIEHPDLPKTADLEFEVEEMDGCSNKSFKAPPVEIILKRFEEYSDDKNFYMKHYYFDMRKSFDLNIHQKRSLQEFNFLGNKMLKNHVDEDPEVPIYATKSEKGFSSKTEYALFLRRIPEEVGDNFEQFGLPIIMI